MVQRVLKTNHWEQKTVFRTKVKRVHFVGIGGIGMSGIAEVLVTLGFTVSGSDLKESINTARLRKMGVMIQIGHEKEIVKGADVVVTTSALSATNPETAYAAEIGIPVIPRAEMLNELMKLKDGIAIAGTHGKTTTTSLVAWILTVANLDPTFVVGGRLASFETNARLGESRLLVAEADESDGSFLRLTPSMNIITNIEPEHLDYYGSMEALNDAFVTFANHVPFYGVNVVCLDHVGVKAILHKIERRCVTYAIDSEADFQAVDISTESLGCAFTLLDRGIAVGRFTLSMPGRHNILNALGAIASARELEVNYEDIQSALSTFAGVDRRFQVCGIEKGVTVVDDYGHHPSEILATLNAARAQFDGKIYAIFQPHRYTRVRDLMNQFAACFHHADCVFVSDIYKASETPIPGITSEALVQAIQATGHPCVKLAMERENIAADVCSVVKNGDVVITLGAGDINKTCGEILDLLENK